MEISIRIEEEKDYRRVEEITRQAFSYPGRIEQGGIGSTFEHWMVYELRKRDGIKELSLVAEANNQLVGHIICSNARIETPRKSSIHVLDFGPISVLPQYQRQGIGKTLMRSMIDKARNMGYGAIMFFGRPEYYPQFGFVEAVRYGITDRNGKNYPAFMAMELVAGYLANAQRGKFFESDIYNDSQNTEVVKEFDISFR
ncbi:MAG: N-acetyltransferase [Dehalococcoidales bacterium]|nr:N-acetyltransferase [Dehalococcoidales bacterium]